MLTGLEADFCVPVRHLASHDPARPVPLHHAPEARDTAPVEKIVSGSVLLVEDSLIIAMDAEDILARLGAERVVTVASLAQAQAEIARERFDAAVLDVNLGQETSLPIADELRAAGVPWIFATGYGEQLQLPPVHQGTPVIQKPYTLTSVGEGLRQALARG